MDRGAPAIVRATLCQPICLLLVSVVAALPDETALAWKSNGHLLGSHLRVSLFCRRTPLVVARSYGLVMDGFFVSAIGNLFDYACHQSLSRAGACHLGVTGSGHGGLVVAQVGGKPALKMDEDSVLACEMKVPLVIR